MGPVLSASLGFCRVASPASVKSCGCAVLFRPSVSFVSSCSDDDGCFLLCEFSFHYVRFGVACVYAPNRNPDRNSILEFVSDSIDLHVQVILAGDFT